MLCNRWTRLGKRGSRFFSSGVKTPKIWDDFTRRSASLKLQDNDIHESLFQGIGPGKGPASIKNRERRMAYHSPLLIDETFKLAYNVVESESEKMYQKIDTLQQHLDEQTKLGSEADQDKIKELEEEICQLQAKAEMLNPEVMYNSHFLQDSMDRSQPVYRKFLEDGWRNYDLMITMQRLEQLHVIPDTMPTLDPKVDVKVKFGHNTDPAFAGWITPGLVLPSFAVAYPPTIQIQQFDNAASKNLFSVLIVNPDTPDLTTNSFKTTLHYGLANVALDNIDNTISPAKLLAANDENVFKQYVPILPEMNAQTQRACLWVFKHTNEIKPTKVDPENFDIRQFASDHDLTAVGAHVWRQHFDRSVNDLRSKFALEHGRVFHRVRRPYPLTDHAS